MQTNQGSDRAKVPLWMRMGRLIVVATVPSIVLFGSIELLTRALRINERVERRVTGKLYPQDGKNLMFATREYDALLSWRLRPNSWLPHNIGYINSMGFVGPERSRRKPPDTLRVLTLGDSVTYGAWGCGNPRLCRDNAYPDALQTVLWGHTRQSNVEVINAGVYGYDTMQGIRYFRAYLGDLQPDVVTIMFGWNDHGQLRGPEGKDLRGIPWHWLSINAQSLATYRAALAAMELLPKPTSAGMPTSKEHTPRVSVDEYEQNVTDLVHLIRRRGAQPLLITEPVGPLSEIMARYPELQPWTKNQIPDYSTLTRIHLGYNAAIRRIAEQEHVALVDAEGEFAARDVNQLFDPYDMVHPNEAGHLLLAQMILAAFQRQGWVAR